MTFQGVIIEESLDNAAILKELHISDTKIEPVEDGHKTPWLKQWTMHTVIIPEEKADLVAERLSEDLEKEHNWYADFKNEQYHFIVYRGKVFKVDLSNPTLYKEAKQYGMSLGIPEYQIDFAPDDKT